MRRLILVCIVSLLILSLCPSCKRDTGGADEKGKLVVVTSLFPLYDFAKHIGKDRAEVSLLIPPGVESHSFEPKPRDMIKIYDADMFIYTGAAMEPWVADIIAGIQGKNLLIIDASTGIAPIEKSADPGDEHRGTDPHIWLDLAYAQKMVDTMCAGFIEKDPVNKTFYTDNAAAYKSSLTALDTRFQDALSRCEKKIVIHGGHFAFGYLARRYHLTYVAAYGFSPDSEPTPKRLYELSELTKRNHITHIFYEELLNPRVAETIARETGATLLKLNAAHNITKDEMDRGVSFIAIMEQNLKNLIVGLQCR
ncbi:MAG: zinc ABC transporter substrate-binding protein [Proteobacteria bacterium]|nr:zinc ABC transporter substrate-binding protein [Pseudomonadota bacterium]